MSVIPNCLNFDKYILWFVLLCTVCSSCGELRGVQPIPPDKQSFIGSWKSDVGITIEIFSKGTANVLRTKITSESDTLAINASDPTNFRVYFPSDSTLLLIQPFNIAREYKIGQYPIKHNRQITMILNGVKLVKED